MAYLKIDATDMRVLTSDATSSVKQLRLSENCRFLAVAGDTEIVLFNIENAKYELRLELDANVASIEWVGSSGLLVGDHLGSVHLFA